MLSGSGYASPRLLCYKDRMSQPTKTPRWTRRSHARPAEIVEAALQCFAEKGFAATRLDDVARKAGVTKGTIYLYFPDKEALLRAAIEGTLAPDLSEMIATARKSPSAADAIRALLRQFVNRIPGSLISCIPKLIICESANFPSLTRLYFDAVVSQGFSVFHDLIRLGIEQGEFRDDLGDIDAVVFQIIAPILLATLWKHSIQPFDPKPDRIDPRRLVESHLRLLLRAMANPSAKPVEKGQRTKNRSRKKPTGV